MDQQRTQPDDPSMEIAAVTGLRALSVLWMISFHVLFFGGYQVDGMPYSRWLAIPSLVPLSTGYHGVDIFFVISGFLIARMLLAERDRSKGLRIGRFYVRRVMRIFPAYLVTLWIGKVLWGGDSHSENTWANLLLVNNFLPYDKQSLGWTWSLAVEEQFYLLFPLALLLAHRMQRGKTADRESVRAVIICLFAFVFALMIRMLLVFGSGPSGIVCPTPFHPKFSPELFGPYFDSIYDKLHTRMGGIICGIGVAYTERCASILRWFHTHRGLTRWGLAVALLALSQMVFGHSFFTLWTGGPTSLGLSTAIDTYLFALLISYVLLYLRAQSAVGESGAIHRFLAWRGFRPIARLSYSAYLLHPLVILFLWSRLPLAAAEMDELKLWILILCCVLASLAAASILFLLIERPFHRLGRKLTA